MGHSFLHPPRPAFSYCAVRPPFGDLHGCPAPLGWRSRYRCVNLDVAVALPVPAVASPSFVVIVAVAKALRSLDSLVYPLRCVVPVYILILCALFRSLPFSIVVASGDCGAVSALASVLLVSPDLA